jgi:hypothetical protein
MRRIRVSAKGVLAVASLGLAFAAAAGAAPAAASGVIVPPGAPVQIAFVADRSGAAASYYAGIRNAARMALQLQGTIRGFRVQLNDDLDAPCASIAQGVADANTVVGNPQNVAVIGHFCSPSLGGTGLPGSCPSPGATSALSIYERSGVVVINGAPRARASPRSVPACSTRRSSPIPAPMPGTPRSRHFRSIGCGS